MNMSQDEHELHVTRRFIAHLGDDFRIVEERNRDGRVPDFVISDGLGRVGLELTRYRIEGPENEAQQRDSDFQEYVHGQWIDDPTVNHWRPRLAYSLLGPSSKAKKRFYAIPGPGRERET